MTNHIKIIKEIANILNTYEHIGHNDWTPKFIGPNLNVELWCPSNKFIHVDHKTLETLINIYDTAVQNPTKALQHLENPTYPRLLQTMIIKHILQHGEP